MEVLIENVAESEKGEWNPVGKHQIQPGCENERADAERDSRT